MRNYRFAFYRKVFGVIKIYEQNGWIQAQTPDTRDIIVFDESAKRIGKPGGIEHFGFRLLDPKDIDLAAKVVKKAGGKILDKGKFSLANLICFSKDPDGYEVAMHSNCRRRSIQNRRRNDFIHHSRV
jgi:predicted enzyme related to lactoylglutathione lyase